MIKITATSKSTKNAATTGCHGLMPQQ